MPISARSILGFRDSFSSLLHRLLCIFHRNQTSEANINEIKHDMHGSANVFGHLMTSCNLLKGYIVLCTSSRIYCFFNYLMMFIFLFFMKSVDFVV